jgi:hypothetical protein
MKLVNLFVLIYFILFYWNFVVGLTRLGASFEGAEEIRQHKWFEGFDWVALREGRLPSPIYVSRSHVEAAKSALPDLTLTSKFFDTLEAAPRTSADEDFKFEIQLITPPIIHTVV